MQNNSRTFKSIRNVIFGIGSKVIMLLLTFVSRAVFIKVLGEELLGINSLYTNILYVLSLAELGFGSAMSYSFYKPLADKDIDKLAALIGFYRRVYTIIAMAVAVIGVSLLPFLDVIINLDKPIEHLELYYLLFLANAVASYLFVYKTAIMNADQNNYIINLYSLLTTFLKVVFQIIVLVFLRSFVAYLVIMIISTVLNNVLVSIMTDKMYPYIKNKVNLDIKEKLAIYDNVKSIFVYNVSSTLLDCIDTILISVVISTIAVGYYANYTTVINNVLAFVTILFTAITASVGNLSVNETPEKKYKTYCIMNMIGYGLAAICVTCFYTLIDDLICLWIGKEFVLSEGVLLAFMGTVYIFCTFKPTLAYREAVGLFSKIKYVVLIAAIINASLSFVLGKIIGLSGIIIATIVARGSTMCWYEPIVLHKDYFFCSSKKYFISQIINMLCVALCMFLASTLIKLCNFDNNWFTLVIKGVISLAVVGVVYFIRYFKTEEFRYAIKKVKGALK